MSNSLGQIGPDLLSLLWVLADYAGRSQVLVGLQDRSTNSTLIPRLLLKQLSNNCEGLIYVQASNRILAAVFIGVTELICGHTLLSGPSLPTNEAWRSDLNSGCHPPTRNQFDQASRQFEVSGSSTGLETESFWKGPIYTPRNRPNSVKRLSFLQCRDCLPPRARSPEMIAALRWLIPCTE